MTKRRESRYLRVCLGAAIFLGLAEIVGFFVSTRRGPAFSDWAMLQNPIKEEQKPGDLVIVAPLWGEPLARQALGDAVFPVRDLARPDITRYRSVLLISALGETSAELLGFREISRRGVGPFEVIRLENPHPAELIFDFVDALGPERADVRITSPEAKCTYTTTAPVLTGGLGGHPTFPAARFICPGGPFFNVSVTVIAADEDFRPRRCIWSHPQAKGEVITRFTNVPLGNVIRGHAGMYSMMERARSGAPVSLAIRVDGEEIGRHEHKDGDGWAGFEMPLGAHAGKKSSVVEFAVSTTNYMHRHYCFEADTR